MQPGALLQLDIRFRWPQRLEQRQQLLHAAQSLCVGFAELVNGLQYIKGYCLVVIEMKLFWRLPCAAAATDHN